jgi:hypothetical protein
MAVIQESEVNWKFTSHKGCLSWRKLKRSYSFTWTHLLLNRQVCSQGIKVFIVIIKTKWFKRLKYSEDLSHKSLLQLSSDLENYMRSNGQKNKHVFRKRRSLHVQGVPKRCIHTRLIFRIIVCIHLFWDTLYMLTEHLKLGHLRTNVRVCIYLMIYRTVFSKYTTINCKILNVFWQYLRIVIVYTTLQSGLGEGLNKNSADRRQIRIIR